ncbi:hypothetical protein MMC20_005421 [Loxospora ochrophaea]|nr:hypothetical protein [Loxospora ochrophaea]
MFLAAAPYFQTRFSPSPYLLTHFQPAIISVSTVFNLVSMLALTRLQARASYPRRILVSLLLNLAAFTLLALSTVAFTSISPSAYFTFLMLIVATASLATGFCQNGVFAYVSGFGVPEYTQAIMTGQAVAGVLPCIAQIVSVLSVPEADEGEAQESPKSAFAYFMTATVVSAVTMAAYMWLWKRRGERGSETMKRVMVDGGRNGLEDADDDEDDDEPQTGRKVVSMLTLFHKLTWLALAVFLCFAATMIFPVFTEKIQSSRTTALGSSTDDIDVPRLFRNSSFIPLAFLLWNSGDLAGRLLTIVRPFSALVHYPKSVFALSVLRLAFIPLYLLCNINGRGAIVDSDAFYLFVVQFGFGLTNGYVGSTCMIGAAEWVDEEEREAAGGFMGLMLVGGLSVGSLLSFLVAGA